MIIRVNPDEAVTLEDRDNFKAFKVCAPAMEIALLARSLNGVAEVHDDHAWVSETALRAFDAERSDSDWQAGLSAMIEKARQYGWVDDRNRIRAHIELVDSSP